MSDCVIYFYSSTGNSLTVARMLADEIGDATVVSIPGISSADDPYEDAREASMVGFVFPVHRAALPPIVKKFVAGLPVRHDVYYFALATCSFVGCNEFWELDQLLGMHGMMLNYSTELQFVGGAGTVAPTREEIESNMREIEAQIPDIAAAIRDRQENDPTTNYNGFLDKLVSRFTSTFRTHQKFSVDRACNSCGICAQVCPVGNIELDENGFPKRADRCEGCYACVHWCPEHAVRTTFHYPNRYHNPAVEPEDLKLVEKQGLADEEHAVPDTSRVGRFSRG